MSTPLLQVKNLCTSFDVDAGEVRAVNGISFSLDKGKVLGIVGESGSGKSVTAYSIMRILVEPGRIRVSQANCPDQVCVEMGAISDGTVPIVCLPHKLVIEIVGGAEALDAAAG